MRGFDLASFARALLPGQSRVDARERLRAVAGAALGLLFAGAGLSNGCSDRRTAVPGWWRRSVPAPCWCSPCRPARWHSPGRWSAATRSRRWPASPASPGCPTRRGRRAGGGRWRSVPCSRCAACIRRAAPLRCWTCWPIPTFPFAFIPVCADSLLLVLAGVVYNSLTGRRYPHPQLRRRALRGPDAAASARPTSTPCWPATTRCWTSAATTWKR